MRSSKGIRRSIATLAGAALLLAACGPSGASATPTPLPAASAAPVPSPASATTAVSISDFAFQPAALTVPIGTTITWTNGGATQHTVTADDDSFDSGTLAVGATYSTTAHLAGTIAYHCAIHSQMKGTIVVGP